MIPVIAVVGRPNVGKSTLFNRLTKTRDALVASFSGLTRDRQYGRGAVGGKDFIVVDTGGLSGEEEDIHLHMAEQSMLAIDEADQVFFMVDAQSGRTAGDDQIAEMLRQKDINVCLVANKIDGVNPDYVDGEFSSLGFGDAHQIAALSNQGVRQLIEKTLLVVAGPSEPSRYQGIKMAVVGRPNVGKSTLVNQFLGEQRVVVFDEPGTTRDSIYIPFERHGEKFTLIDTAGVRRRGKVRHTVEKFSVIKTLEAIDDSHVVILLFDAADGVVDQDLHLLSYIIESGRGIVLAVNKWDGTDRDQKNFVRRELERRLVFLDFAKIHFISALKGKGIEPLYDSVSKAYRSANRKFKTNELNQILARAVADHPPPLVHGRRIKLRYAHAGGSNPPLIVIHGNQTESVPDTYRRFLENRFLKALKLEGTPIRFEFKRGENPYAGRKNPLTDRQQAKRRRMISHVKRADTKRKRNR